MHKILTFNNISAKGLQRLPSDAYEVSAEIKTPDAILLRSQDMHGMKIPDSVKAIARAGAGVNNIPIDEMNAKGVVVFNAPGANANAVKELVIAGMLLACRNICQSWNYASSLSGDDVQIKKDAEVGKKKYVGYELPGRTLGVVGLGSIGVRVANAAQSLGMNVIGYDPGITVQNAWQLAANIQQANRIEDLLRCVDFITFHVPLMDATKHIIHAERLKTMKDNVVIMNFARHGIVDDRAVLDAIESGKVATYVTDFPSNELKDNERVIVLPHLGASTHEAEENCAVMVADQLKDYLENGNVRHSVNFPAVNLPRSSDYRLAVVNENRPGMVGQISHLLGKEHVNIVHMINESRNDIAYTLADIDAPLTAAVLKDIEAIDGVLSVRAL